MKTEIDNIIDFINSEINIRKNINSNYYNSDFTRDLTKSEIKRFEGFINYLRKLKQFQNETQKEGK